MPQYLQTQIEFPIYLHGKSAYFEGNQVGQPDGAYFSPNITALFKFINTSHRPT
jgi:hypothetical protein